MVTIIITGNSLFIFLNYFTLSNIYIQLPYINKCDKIELTSIIEILNSNKPDDLRGDDPFMNKVIDEIKRLNQDPNTRALINMLEIKQMDEITLRKMAHEEGIEEGRKEGIQQGIQQGIEQGIQQGIEQGVEKTKINIAKALKDANTSIELIVLTTGLSEEEVRKL